jgi:hypothetical protein
MTWVWYRHPLNPSKAEKVEGEGPPPTKAEIHTRIYISSDYQSHRTTVQRPKIVSSHNYPLVGSAVVAVRHHRNTRTVDVLERQSVYTQHCSELLQDHLTKRRTAHGMLLHQYLHRQGQCTDYHNQSLPLLDASQSRR